eukprot:11383972-Karenia_brevis.AAC.1
MPRVGNPGGNCSKPLLCMWRPFPHLQKGSKILGRRWLYRGHTGSMHSKGNWEEKQKETWEQISALRLWLLT